MRRAAGAVPCAPPSSRLFGYALTGPGAPSTIRRMDAELTRLEHQLEQLIGLYQSGKAEAHELRMHIARLESDNRQLADKVRFATEKLEALLEKLPEA